MLISVIKTKARCVAIPAHTPPPLSLPRQNPSRPYCRLHHLHPLLHPLFASFSCYVAWAARPRPVDLPAIALAAAVGEGGRRMHSPPLPRLLLRRGIGFPSIAPAVNSHHLRDTFDGRRGEERESRPIFLIQIMCMWEGLLCTSEIALHKLKLAQQKVRDEGGDRTGRSLHIVWSRATQPPG